MQSRVRIPHLATTLFCITDVFFRAFVSVIELLAAGNNDDEDVTDVVDKCRSLFRRALDLSNESPDLYRPLNDAYLEQPFHTIDVLPTAEDDRDVDYNPVPCTPFDTLNITDANLDTIVTDVRAGVSRHDAFRKYLTACEEHYAIAYIVHRYVHNLLVMDIFTMRRLESTLDEEIIITSVELEDDGGRCNRRLVTSFDARWAATH